jgi:hypothetical protein
MLEKEFILIHVSHQPAFSYTIVASAVESGFGPRCLVLSTYSTSNTSKVEVELVVFLLHSRKILGSNFDPKTRYPVGIVPDVSQTLNKSLSIKSEIVPVLN